MRARDTAATIILFAWGVLLDAHMLLKGALHMTTSRRYPVSNHRLKRTAQAHQRRLQAAQDHVALAVRDAQQAGQPVTFNSNSRLAAAFRLLQENGVLVTDRLSVHRARLWSWRVYRDPA